MRKINRLLELPNCAEIPYADRMSVLCFMNATLSGFGGFTHNQHGDMYWHPASGKCGEHAALIHYIKGVKLGYRIGQQR